MPSIALATEGKRQRIEEKRMFYTYILRSISHPDQRYIGSTADLKSRLAKHNAGEVPHTSKFQPGFSGKKTLSFSPGGGRRSLPNLSSK